MTIVTRGVTRKIQVNNSRREAISSSIDRTKASARHGTRFASRAAIAAANARPSSIHVDASSIPPPPMQNQDSLTNQPNASVPPDLDLNSYLSEVINIEKKVSRSKSDEKATSELDVSKEHFNRGMGLFIDFIEAISTVRKFFLTFNFDVILF